MYIRHLYFNTLSYRDIRYLSKKYKYLMGLIIVPVVKLDFTLL
jgi:hypothetical protein